MTKNLLITATRQFAEGCKQANAILGTSTSALVRQAVIQYCTKKYEEAKATAEANRRLIALQNKLRASLKKRKQPDGEVYIPEEELMAKARQFEELARKWQAVLETFLMDDEGRKMADEEEEEEVEE